MAALRTRASASETGDSSFAVRIEMGAHELVGDEPETAGGLGLGPSPFDLLTASLAECSAMTVRWFARQHGWPLDQVEVVIDHVKKLLPGAADSTDVFEKTVFIRGPRLDDAQRLRLIEIAARCPVQRLLQGAPFISTKAGKLLDEAHDA